MTTIIACLIATTSTAAFLTLWFWVVHHELIAKKDTVNSAEIQLVSCRKKHMQSRNSSDESDAQGILTLSHDIYRQSVTLYNQTLLKPWNRIPGFLMGFQQIKEGKNSY